MRRAFDIVMRLVSSLLGLALVAIGTVWILQGLNLAFRVGFMVGDKHWTVYGALLALVGLAQVIWTNTRTSRPPLR
jgi:drug/metabolite transporter superfamily protein YnfA